jgi:flagellar hook-length control protein FliK
VAAEPVAPPKTIDAPAPTAGDLAVGEITGASAAAPADAPGNKDHAAGHILPGDAAKPAAPTEAPAPVALRPMRSPNMPMGVTDQVAVNIHRHVADGNERFTIMLKPEELGRIDIRLEIAQDGRVSAIVAVDRPQTLELLQRDSRGLERALQDAGLKADSDSLSFSLRDDGAPSFADQQEGGRQSTGRRGRGFGGGDDDAADAAILQTLTLGPGRVDVRV